MNSLHKIAWVNMNLYSYQDNDFNILIRPEIHYNTLNCFKFEHSVILKCMTIPNFILMIFHRLLDTMLVDVYFKSTQN